ncbi:hypothetical protein [Sphaerotilus mobilis]|nr:hypothetical protein [Sphaerotilus mobilis]
MADLPHAHAPTWSTACEGDDGATSPGELKALGEHLRVCAHLKGRWFGLHCVLAGITGYAAGHVVTSLITLAGLALLLSLVA